MRWKRLISQLTRSGSSSTQGHTHRRWPNIWRKARSAVKYRIQPLEQIGDLPAPSSHLDSTRANEFWDWWSIFLKRRCLTMRWTICWCRRSCGPGDIDIPGFCALLAFCLSLSSPNYGWLPNNATVTKSRNECLALVLDDSLLVSSKSWCTVAFERGHRYQADNVRLPVVLAHSRGGGQLPETHCSEAPRCHLAHERLGAIIKGSMFTV